MQSMDDKSRLNDSIISQKLIASTYNSYVNECSSPQLRADFLNILKEEHDIQFDIFNEMSMRGWYQAKPAEPQSVMQARQKFSNMVGSS